MPIAIDFTTSKFDVTMEDENSINPIFGQSLLLWLKQKVADKVEITEPDTEDWGWYAEVDWNGRSYLLGAIAMEDTPPDFYWVFQVDKHRTMKEIVFGREKMTREDECLRYFKAVLESEPEFRNVALIERAGS